MTTHIPPIEEAPKNTFRGVRKDGDPIDFLYATYGEWLQDGRKVLDQRTLKSLDQKLINALQARTGFKKDSILPSHSEARQNLQRFKS